MTLLSCCLHRDLRCLRNTIHVNLFVTYILSASVWFVLLAYQVRMHQGHSPAPPPVVCQGSKGLSLSRPQETGNSGHVGCAVFVTFYNYFTVTNFFWMLVEGA